MGHFEGTVEVVGAVKILWISHNVPYPPHTGVLQRNYNLVKEAGKIADIYLVAFLQKGILPIEFKIHELHERLGEICHRVEILEMPVERGKRGWYSLLARSTFDVNPYEVIWLRSREMQGTIRELVGRVRFDIVHFDTLGLAQYWMDVERIPKILNHHNIESSLMERRSEIEENPLKKMYFKMQAKKLKTYEIRHCNLFDINFVVSACDKELLREIVPEDRIEVIPNGVDTDYFTLGEFGSFGESLIFVGGMKWGPNRDAVSYLLKDIWPLVSKELPEMSLTVVGAHPPRELLRLAESDRRVRVTGFVEDVRPYLRAAGIYICPMRWGGGTRLKILDALGMGKAIVSTSVGCEGIDVLPGRSVLIGDTPGEIVAEVKRLVGSRELRERIGREGRKLVEGKYSWRVIGKTLNEVYERVYRLRSDR